MICKELWWIASIFLSTFTSYTVFHSFLYFKKLILWSGSKCSFILCFQHELGQRDPLAKVQSRGEVQFSSVAQSSSTLCNPMNRSMPGLPVHHQLPEFTQTCVHRVSDAIQLSHPLLSPSHPALNPSQHQGLFHWVNSLHEVAKVLEFQL